MALGPAPLPPLSFFFETTTYDAGVFAINRSDAQAAYATKLYYNRVLSCEYGSFALNGQDATLTYDDAVTTINPAPLPIWNELTLQATGAYVLVGEHGTFYMTRSDQQAATAAYLRKGRALVAETGTFGLAGAPAERDMEMNGDPGAFFVVGQSASLMVGNRKIAAEYGSFAMSGQVATMTKESPADRVLTAEAGTFWLSRSDQAALTAVSFGRGAILACDFGSFTFTGQSATLDGPVWTDAPPGSGSWVYITPSGGVWTDVDPDS